MPALEISPDHEMKPHETRYTVQTPDGTQIFVSYFSSIGTQILIYENPDHNPVVTYERKAKKT